MPEASDIDRIRLVEIVETDGVPGIKGQGPQMRVTLAFGYEGQDPILQTTLYFPRKDWPDDALLPVAKNAFHRLCGRLKDATVNWELSQEYCDSLKRPLL